MPRYPSLSRNFPRKLDQIRPVDHLREMVCGGILIAAPLVCCIETSNLHQMQGSGASVSVELAVHA
jgi:hypothetical protein